MNSRWTTMVGKVSVALLLLTSVAACSAPAASPAAPPATEVAATATSEQAAEEVPAEEAVQDAPPVTNTKLNLNTVTGEDLLATIPDFGSRMVREFQEYRPYISIQQFRREIGKYVDEAQVAAYEQYVYVPVNVNEADAETLKQIPGVDDAMAEALMVARPYESNQAFLDKLAESLSAEQVAVAVGFLETE